MTDPTDPQTLIDELRRFAAKPDTGFATMPLLAAADEIERLRVERDGLLEQLQAVTALLRTAADLRDWGDNHNGQSWDRWAVQAEDIFSGAATNPSPAQRCNCDGASSFTDEQNRVRHPFIVNANCPIHGTSRASSPAKETE